MIIAAVAEANDCVLVTDNEKDFIGLKIVNPCGRELEPLEIGNPGVNRAGRVLLVRDTETLSTR